MALDLSSNRRRQNYINPVTTPQQLGTSGQAKPSSCSSKGGKEGEEKTRGGEVNVMVRIAEEIRLWLQLEPFRFPPASLNWNQNVKDVRAVMSLLSMLLDFLKLAEIAEDQCVLELLSKAIKNEDRGREFLWWFMTEDIRCGMDRVLLGNELANLLRNYSCARKVLSIVAREKLNMIRTWTDAFVNGEAKGALEEIHIILSNVRNHFTKWALQVQFEKNSSYPVPLPSTMMMPAIQKEMDQLVKKVSSSPMPGFPSRKRKMSSCSEDCYFKSEFLHFSSPHHPPHQPDRVTYEEIEKSAAASASNTSPHSSISSTLQKLSISPVSSSSNEGGTGRESCMFSRHSSSSRTSSASSPWEPEFSSCVSDSSGPMTPVLFTYASGPAYPQIMFSGDGQREGSSSMGCPLESPHWQRKAEEDDVLSIPSFSDQVLTPGGGGGGGATVDEGFCASPFSSSDGNSPPCSRDMDVIMGAGGVGGELRNLYFLNNVFRLARLNNCEKEI